MFFFYMHIFLEFLLTLLKLLVADFYIPIQMAISALI